MDKARQLLGRRPSYEPIAENNDETQETAASTRQRTKDIPYSKIDYWIFLLLGVSMLWAWYISKLNLSYL